MKEWIEPGSVVEATANLQLAKADLNKALKRVQELNDEVDAAQRAYRKARETESRYDARLIELKHLESGKCAGMVRDRDGWGSPSKCHNRAKPGERFCGIHVKSLKMIAERQTA